MDHPEFVVNHSSPECTIVVVLVLLSFLVGVCLGGDIAPAVLETRSELTARCEGWCAREGRVGVIEGSLACKCGDPTAAGYAPKLAPALAPGAPQ